MRTIPHRELRNYSARILAAVKDGELIQVTNGGEVAAIMVPPNTPKLEVFRLAGKVSTPAPIEDLDDVVAVVADVAIEAVVDDLRGGP